MWDLLMYLIWMVVLIGAVFGVIYAAKMFLSGSTTLGAFLPRARERRLDVIDHANVDGKRRLLLIRRDNVEHLIMTGGPVDVVIETGINGVGVAVPDVARVAPKQTVEAPQNEKPPARDLEPVFSRPARAFSKAVGEN